MAHGNQSPSRDPAKAGESMLASVEYLVPLLDRLLTMKQNAVHLYAYPTPKLTGFAGNEAALGEDGRPPPIEFRPGEILPLFPGEDLSLLQWSGTPPDLDELIALTRSMIDQAGVPTVLFGIAPDGNTSGYYLNQLINTARLSFNQITRHAEQALERIVQLAWRLVEHRVRETVYVYGDEDAAWLGLSPRDLDGYYAVRAKLEALAPADEIAQGTYAANLVSAKLASRRWAMQEKLGIANATESWRPAAGRCRRSSACRRRSCGRRCWTTQRCDAPYGAARAARRRMSTARPLRAGRDGGEAAVVAPRVSGPVPHAGRGAHG